jgi:hypothetical protein
MQMLFSDEPESSQSQKGFPQVMLRDDLRVQRWISLSFKESRACGIGFSDPVFTVTPL